MVAGPVAGVVVGTAVEQSFGLVHDAFFARSLSPDEARRAEIVFEAARKRVFNRLAHGDAPADWVTDTGIGGRASSIEVLEAGLWRARDEFEERKLEHLAALLAWLLFQPNLSAEDAHHFLALAARLRYRQLLLIAVLADDEQRSTLPDKQWEASMLWKDMALVMEAAELAHEGVILHEGEIHSGTSYENINLARMTVLLQGSVLHEGMELADADPVARAALIEHINGIGVIVVERADQ